MKSVSDGSEPPRLLEAAARSLERGDPEVTLKLVERALRDVPGDISALHLRAAALAELQRDDEARVAYEAALRVADEDLELLADAADFYVSSSEEHGEEWGGRGLELARRAARLARRLKDRDALRDVVMIEATATTHLGRPRDALALIDGAVAECGEHPELLAERGIALYELCRFDDARNQLLSVIKKAPEHALAHHTLGLIAERQGDSAEAARRFAAARRLPASEFPEPVRLCSEAFDRAVEDALSSLPEQISQYLSNVAIAVEDLPRDEDLLAAEPPLSPSILGLFRGTPLGEKASMDPWSHFPSSIVLYQKNLERLTNDRDVLVEEIRITLVHEVGHFLGLDEHDLWERGLD